MDAKHVECFVLQNAWKRLFLFMVAEPLDRQVLCLQAIGV